MASVTGYRLYAFWLTVWIRYAQVHKYINKRSDHGNDLNGKASYGITETIGGFLYYLSVPDFLSEVVAFTAFEVSPLTSLPSASFV